MGYSSFCEVASSGDWLMFASNLVVGRGSVRSHVDTPDSLPEVFYYD